MTRVLYDYIVRPSHFPKVTDETAEQKKLNFLRIITGLILLVRMGHVAFSAYFYFPADVHFAGFAVPLQCLLAIGIMSVGVLFTVGLFTPLASIVLILYYRDIENWMLMSTLGTDVLYMLLLLFFITNTGSSYSLDARLLRGKSSLSLLLKKLYAIVGFPDVRQMSVYYFLGFLSFAMVNFSSISYHLMDAYWLKGQTIAVMLTNSYLTDFYGVFRTIEAFSPKALFLFSAVSGVFQTIYQVLMIPLIYFRYGRIFVVLWGLSFFAISVVLLQLSYLAYLEVVLWTILFLPTASSRVVVFFDDQCGFCSRIKTILGWLDFTSAGDFKGRSSHMEEAAAHGITADMLQGEMQGLYQNRVIGGFDLFMLLSWKILLLLPLYPVFWLLKRNGKGERIYKWVAQRRTQISGYLGLIPRVTGGPIQLASQHRVALPWIYCVFLIAAWLYALLTSPFIISYTRSVFVHLRPVGVFLNHYSGIRQVTVFNREDLSMGDFWPYIIRYNTDGSTQDVPFSDINGARQYYHLSDVLYFGNGLLWRRTFYKVRSAEFLKKGRMGYDFLEKVVHYDARRYPEPAPLYYKVAIFNNRSSNYSQDHLKERYEPRLLGYLTMKPPPKQ